MPQEVVYAFVDYENIRMAFRDYVEYITVADVISAFEKQGGELGELRGITFFGDWTRRPQDAHEIENRGYRADMVLSARLGAGKDRSDSRMSFAMDDMSREANDITAYIVGAGDADYKEAILRVRARGKRLYVLSFGSAVSREYFTMTHGVFPLESLLGVTTKSPVQPLLPGPVGEPLAIKNQLIHKIDSLEKTLPYVVKSYLIRSILVPTHIYGETEKEVQEFLNELITEGILLEKDVDNPKRPGVSVKVVALSRENQAVIDALTL